MDENKITLELEPTPAPTLTFDPLGEAAAEAAPAEKKDEMAGQQALDESTLTEEERKMVNDFAEQIDITNSNQILQFGAGSQKKMADFSETALKNVKSKDLGEVGGMLSNVVAELKSIEMTEEESKSFFGLFKKASNKITAIQAKYAKAETNVNDIVKALEGHQVQLLKDIAVLDKMYDMNLVYFKELSMYILAGKKKLKHAQEVELAELRAKAQESGLPEDAQKANDFAELINRFEKKLHDLELTRMVSLQTAPQIRLIQNNDIAMSEKIQSTIVNTIPLWKSQMVLALGIAHSGQAAKAEREVNDLTNDLLKKNADTLKMATIETAKETERGVVDMETLKHTNETLISTLDEVMKIQEEGRTKRAEAEVELSRIENELKSKLLELHK